jgi:lipopolysaccharide/colanic/teichoic acid biosynthesis glycosyltransferase
MPHSFDFPASARVDFIPVSVSACKRGLDIVLALLAILLTLPLWPLVALAVRLDSKGPAIFRQMRVGQVRQDRTELFWMLKFRSMRSDAESVSGPVWSRPGDPRITQVGRFLRATRLDELPQLLNVLVGDMSIVGPRPERPALYGVLDRAVPFFADRTTGLRPGITGLSQISQGYDRDLDDVRRKLGFDTAYAMRLSSLGNWLKADIGIMLRTVIVMGGGQGR